MTIARTICAVLLLAAILGGSAGCATLLAPTGPRQNYALLEGTEATHPAFIDGDLQTVGETAFPQSEGTSRIGIESPPTEAYVLLPDVFTINAIRIHSDALRGIDLLVEDPTQGWKFHGKYDGLKGSVIELPMKGIVRASGIKVRVRLSTGDQAMRQKNLRTDRFGNRFWTGETRAPAPIAEIEIMGPALRTTASVVDEQASAIDEEISSILREDLAK